MPDRPRTDIDAYREALKRGKDCPTIEELETLLGELPPGNFVRHVEDCAHCRTELEMLRSFHSDEIPAGDAAAVQAITKRLHAGSPEIFGRARAEPWWKGLLTGVWLRPATLTAAALLVVAGVAIQIRHSGVPPINEVRDAGKEVLRSSTIAVLAPVGDVPQAPSEVRWEAAPTAARYRVRLLEVDRTELWKADVSEPRAALPPEVRRRIVPAKTLLWEVSAFDSAGRKVAESEVASFRFSQKVYTH